MKEEEKEEGQGVDIEGCFNGFVFFFEVNHKSEVVPGQGLRRSQKS